MADFGQKQPFATPDLRPHGPAGPDRFPIKLVYDHLFISPKVNLLIFRKYLRISLYWLMKTLNLLPVVMTTSAHGAFLCASTNSFQKTFAVAWGNVEKVKTTFRFVMQMIILLATVNAAATPIINVALNATVTLDGTGFKNNGNRALPLSVTDGVFLDDTHAWNTGTVYWLGAKQSDTLDSVTVTLGSASVVSSIRLQADTLDTYTLDYRNGAGPWQALTTMETVNSPIGYTYTHGMGTGDFALAAPVTASAFRIRGNGDGLYAVSEFQAFGLAEPVSVPEPATWGMLAAGIGLIGFLRRRRNV